MSRERLVCVALALLAAGCTKVPLDGSSGFDASLACEDRDHDGFGRGCERGYDCNDDDPRQTTECRTCSRPERGCECVQSDGPVTCFLDDRALEGGDVLCREGTRVCREGKWSACEDVHEYVASPASDTQRVLDPGAGKLPCSICDVKCFQVTDNLLSDGGVAGGNVTFGPGGGITLLPGDGGTGGTTTDAGGSGLMGCEAMEACCSTLSDNLQTACYATANGGDNTVCERDRFAYCPTGSVTGPVAGCTVGTGADTDCDGIPNVVDNYPGNYLSSSNNQTIFHQLDVGESEGNSVNISFKLRNADVYFLLDMTNTMKEERDNLISSLTTGNVVNCAQLNQCCNRLINASTKASCQAEFSSYTNQPGKSDDQTKCLSAQYSYCPGNKPVDCPDNDGNGMPDNFLKTQGVVGATRCLVGSSWFGAGFSRELPVGYEPEGCSAKNGTCSTRYADRDEQAFKHVIDMTPDYPKVLTALQSMTTDGNWDDPEAGMLALYSVITGKGHYFGINRPSIAPRIAATQCPPNSVGYPCFRKDAVPIVVFFTDRPHHNGPADSTHCNGEGDGCPYNGLSPTAPVTSWTTAAAESSTDKQARLVPPSAETFATAYNAGDVRGQYVTLVGDTRFMVGDYPTALIGCGAAADAPDALIRFRVSTPAGATGTVAPTPINFHLTKDDVYAASNYGAWDSSRQNDPSPATEFGSVLTVYRGVPNSVSSTIDLSDRQAYAVASGPDSTYLSYTGTTQGKGSGTGYLGGISGCAADGMTNQMLFTFRPTTNARIVVDASGSSFPAIVSLHSGLPSSLPKNPNMTDGTSVGIVNTNDAFATANAVPTASTAIDGAYVERIGDTNVSTIHADYTTPTSRNITAKRTLDSDTLTSASPITGLEVGMPLSDSTNWSATPVRILAITGTSIKLSAKWEGAGSTPTSDGMPVPLTFLDSLVGCGVDPAGRESVFKFNVATPRRVRIDTEGSSFDTVISLHDAPPPSIVAKNDVAANGTTPGYAIGDAYNASYTLSDVNMGTKALADGYAYAQCGAAPTSKDGIVTFSLSQPTHLAIDVTGSSWNPVVGLFSSKPGTSVVLDNTANKNDKLTAPSLVFDIGDAYGNVDTTVKNSDLTGMVDDFQSGIVGCGAISGGRDQIFKFTPLSSTRVRVIASPGSGWSPVIAVFDDPPPASTAITTSTAFDASAVALPDSNCLAYSFHDPASSAPAHTYTFCPSARYASDANSRCGSAGMDYLASINSAAEQAFVYKTTLATSLLSTFHIGAIDNVGTGAFQWRDATALTYSNWASGEPNGMAINNKCADITPAGTWQDGKCSSSGAALTDNTYYVCEDATPTAAPNEDAVTAYAIPAGSTRVVTGSTRRMSSDYNGATLLSACNGTISGGDAVFSITTDSSTSYPLAVDSAGSSYNVVLGIFENTIDAAGYKGCDAFGGAALQYTLLPSRKYYIVVKGTASTPEGSYKLKFTNTSTSTANGTELTCAAATSALPKPSVDVDVDANHTYYIVVDQADSLFGKYDLEVHSLYLRRSEVANASSVNETGSNALQLPDPYRSRISVVDTSTAGMTADYGNGSTGMCTTSPAAPDAVYKFTPSLSTNVTFTVKPNGPGLNNVGIGVFDGLPGTSAVPHDLNATGNPNERGTSAELVPLTGPQQLYTGNTSMMSADVDPSLLACGAKSGGHDAVFNFHLDKPTNVEVDAAGSTVTDPVIGLYKAGLLSKPSQVTLENDTKYQADANPAPTANITNATWLYYGADLSHLSAESQSSVSLAAVNDDALPATKQPQDLGDVVGKRFVIGGGDTSPMLADYPGKWSCGGIDAAPDALYKLYSSTGGPVHVKATPESGYDSVIALYDGSNGAPLRLADVSSLTEDAACVPPNGPKNLTNTTLKTISPLLNGSANVLANCGNTLVFTDDPDGSGPLDVRTQNWCGTAPTTLVQSQPDGPDLVVIYTQSMQVAAGSSLRVLGSRPVLFVVSGTATINGVLTVTPDSLTNPNYPGGGGDFGCGSSRGGNAQSSGTNSGGGGGGGFGTAGGLGGVGSSSSVLGGPAGSARGTATLTPLLGGCSGGDGAFGSAGGMAAGALQISATSSIVLGASASIVADGGNGAVGPSGQAGGSGAASGGAILLQSPTVTFTAGQLSAKGGNGGAGLGSPSTPGGTGAANASSPGTVGQPGSSAAGGGGGGGGYGRVVVAAGSVSLAPCTSATNENASSAWPIILDTSGREYIELGNTSSMTANHGGMCGTPVASPDAVYAFTLSKPTTVRIDGRNSGSNTVLGLFNANNLGQAPTPLQLENDDRLAADARPAPTPDVSNNWIAYKGDLRNLSAEGQPQTNVDNSGNANEIIATELGDPIDRRINVLNADTTAMSADYLAASCSTPAADTARDAIYRFVASKNGQVRVSANNTDTKFDPVIALYRGAHNMIDERLLLQNLTETSLAKTNVDVSSIKIYNLARTLQYAGPGASAPDYGVIARDGSSPVGILRTLSSTIPNNQVVSVDYTYDSGAPLPISQQQLTQVNLGAAGNKNENADTAAQVPMQTGTAYLYTGDTTSMTSDVDGSLFSCGPPAPSSRDATFDFSLDKSTTVSISSEGSGFDTTLAVFASPYSRPSITALSSPAAVLTQLYDVRQILGAPEANCSPYDYASTRYWLCETPRAWGQAEGLCQGVGLHLVTLDNSGESDALLAQIQPLQKDHHIGFTETVPYTNSWGVWTSGGGGTAGSTVQARYVRWETNEPNGSGNCLQMLSSGNWDDADCATAKAYVCERNDNAPATAPSGSSCGAVLSYNAHSYFACTDTLDWASASARCASAGMVLAHVDEVGENNQLRVLLNGGAGWIGGTDAAVEGQWVWTDNSADFWLVTAFRNWASGEPNQPTTNPGSFMRALDGLWEDTPSNSALKSYICENPVVPTDQPTPSTADSPQNVDVFSAQRQFRGSTEGAPNSVGNYIECGANGLAPDAVFVLTLKYKTTLSVDISGSFPNSVVGLFKDDFSGAGYMAGGSRCGLGSAGSPQLMGALDAGKYFLVITGTTAAASGGYNLRFDATTTDPAAFTMKNDTLTQAHDNPLGSVDGKWLVKGADMIGLTPTVGAVTPVDMGTGMDDNDVAAHSLGSIQDRQVVVTNASTGDLAVDYPAGTCSSAVGPDALYSFTAVDPDPMQIRFTPSGWNGQVVVYDGPPVGTSSAPPAPISLAPSYPNETPLTARSATVAVAQAYLGNLTMMANDVPAAAFNQSFNAGSGAPTSCSADATGSDAFFTFNFSGAAKNVEISSAGSAIAHTIALWDSKPFVKPNAVTRQFDTRAAGLMTANLLGGADIDDDWIVVKGDTSTLTPYLGYTKRTEGTDYAHDDTTHALGDIKGLELVTVNASTTGLLGDYLASTMQCSGASDTAPDAIYSFTHGTGGKVRVSLNNPTPAFAAKLALFKGSPTTAASSMPTMTAVPNTNEAQTSAYVATTPAGPAIYTGTTAAMASNYPGSVFTQGSAYGSSVCNPDAAGKDAFLKFTTPGTKNVSPNVTVELASLTASFDQTIAIWDTTPITAPTVGTMSNDTRGAAYSNTIGTIDDDWVVKSATMSSLMPGALTAASPTVAANDDVQDLGNPVGKRINVAGATNVSGVTSDFPAATLGSCAMSDTPADMIYKVRPTANTTIRAAVNNPNAPSFTPAVAILNGATGHPQRFVDTTPASGSNSYCISGFNYTPSNFTVGSGAGQANFSTAPAVSLTCASTITFNSSTNTWTGYCSGQTQPTAVTKTQTGGPDLTILPFKSLTVGSSTVIKLIGTRAVVFAVEGDALIQGTIDASAAAATAGAGGNYSCGTSQGGDAAGKQSLEGGGGGGGGFGTAGGVGGTDHNSAGGAAGAARGTSTLSPLLGGCSGGKGGYPCSGSNGGAGGGAVQISAGAALTVSGTIKANGGIGDNAGCNDSGGEGGGSGGGILLEGATVSSGTLQANGGKGGASQGNKAGGAGSTSSASAGSNGATGALSGAGAGGGGYGRTYSRAVPCVPPNDTTATATSVPIGLSQTFTSPTAGLASNLAGLPTNWAGCVPDSTGPDAFYSFTLTRTTTVEAKASGTGYNHTLAIFNSAMAAQICQDGTSAAPALLSKSLGPGKYYVGFKTRNSNAGGTYTLAIRDTSAGPPYSPSLACGASGYADAALTANTDYYILVKGASSGESGTYNLTVTDIGAVPDFGCGTDLSAPDAYFDFTVKAASRNVGISLNETTGKLNGSFQLYRDVAPLNDPAGDVAVSACQTSAFTYNALTAGRYYVAVRGVAVASGAGNLPAEITIRDESGINALDCSNVASGANGTITSSLAAGTTYYAGITSRNAAAGGSYRLQLRDTSVPVGGAGGTWLACADGNQNIDYTISGTDVGMLHYVVVKGASAGAAGAYTMTVTDLSSVQDLCDASDTLQSDPTAPDAYYGFKVTDADGGGRDVTVSLSSSSVLDGVYRLFKSDLTPVGSCHNKSAPFTYADLAPGTYYVALRGKNTASGAANATFELAINDQDAYGSLTCSDGLATGGTTITKTLNPGTYYVGIKPQASQGNPKDYRLTFRDTTMTSTPTPNQIACGSDVMNANVKAGKTYYVMVKGATATDKGAYGLTVTDLGGSAGWNCNDDSGAGDAYFEFNVDDPNGRRVTIDTEGSQLDTVVAIFPLGATIGAAGVLACDDNSGATAKSSKITRDLAPGVYYAVVRPALGAPSTSLPFQLSLRDESKYGAIACGATTAMGKAQVRTTLGPGTYHTVLKGMAGSDKGAYKLRFRDEGPFLNAASEVACNDAQNELLYTVTAGKPYYAVVKGAATNQSGPYRLTVENMVARTGMGCNASASSPDAVYRFHLTNPARVQVDTLGSQSSATTPLPTDTVIALYDASASYFGTNYAVDKNSQPVNCDDDSGDVAKGWSKITANLAGGRDYYVVVKSKSNGWGSTGGLPYTVNVRDLDNNQPIACASANSSLLLTQSLAAGDYRVVVSNATGASGGGPFDVRFKNVTAASSGAVQKLCANGPEEFTYNLTANTPYYLMVKGNTPSASVSDRGQYGLVVETAGSGTISMGCNASPTSPDAFYKFQLAAQGWLNIDTDNSAADTVIALYPGTASSFGTNYAADVNGAVVGCNDDGGSTSGASRIRAELSPGTYYLVVKGKTVGWSAAAQPFNVSIRDETNTGSIACASNIQGNKKITQTLAAGDYNVVLGTTSATGGAYALKFRDTALAAAQSGSSQGCVTGGSLTLNGLKGGKDYYVVVKGDAATDAGGYTLTMEDTVSLAAASGSTSIACAVPGATIDGTYPAGTYYALVTGTNPGANGPYTLRVRDVDALLDNNRLACDDNSGPNLTSVIERDLTAGTHYVVVKGNGATALGSYNLHIRDENGVPDRELVCGGANEAERLSYDVQAGQDYTVLLKGTSTGSSGTYGVKLYDQTGLQAGSGTNLKCLADPQPTTLYGSDWHRKALDFDLSLTPDTYYVAVKGQRSTDKGTFQLNIGDKNARTTASYTPPTWTELQDALATSAARVLPVIATGGDNSKYVPAAESQAKTIALTSHAMRKDGSPIWQKIQKDGRGTGSGLITGIAEIADYLALDVSLVAVDGPDPGASKFRINIAPGNSPSCQTPHPLVDPVSGVCTPRPGNSAGYSCNTQYACTPGAAPKFSVTFTHPSDAPVPPNPNDSYGGYHFKLQILGDKQYLLDEIPVYIIPTTHAPMGPPGGGGSGKYQSAGTYMQDITTATCPAIAGGSSFTNDLPQWSDLYFNAGMPEGTSLDFELCTKNKQSDLASCVWSNGAAATRKKITVRSKGTCASNAQCRGVPGYGNGYCSSGVCQFITQPKVAYDLACTDNTLCPNGHLGAGDYVISSHCETARGAFGYGYCVYDSQPADLGATLLTGEQGLPVSRVRITLHSDSAGLQAPTLYQWNLTYYCKSAQ